MIPDADGGNKIKEQVRQRSNHPHENKLILRFI